MRIGFEPSSGIEPPLALLADVRACRVCAEYLPLPPRPILQFDPAARILVAGQAPGRKAHDTATPFNDASGDRLRRWLGLGRDEFYDPRLVAIVPMAFCYPGRGASGDLPPRPECAPRWRATLLGRLPRLQLTLVIGRHALAYHLPDERTSLTTAVEGWRRHWPDLVPLPHPSPTNNGWFARHRWFEQELVRCCSSASPSSGRRETAACSTSAPTRLATTPPRSATSCR